MTVCNKCGRKMIQRASGPTRCFCSGSIIIENIKTDSLYNIEFTGFKCAKCGNELSKNGSCLVCKLYTVKEGPEIWKKLHSYKYINEKEAKEFFDTWQLMVPSFGCSCKMDWTKIVNDLPPNFSSAKEFFKWGVEAHNRVNMKLGKPIFPYDQALLVYNQQ